MVWARFGRSERVCVCRKAFNGLRAGKSSMQPRHLAPIILAKQPLDGCIRQSITSTRMQGACGRLQLEGSTLVRLLLGHRKRLDIIGKCSR